MDRTPIYIKQCEKAVEIQDSWKPKNLDIFVTKQSHTQPVYPRDYLWDTERIRIMKKEFIWLPRQDQLQGMVGWTSYAKVTHLYGFINRNPSHGDVNARLCSMEQLWLAFVMKEKYNKIWNGEDWVLIDEA